MTVMNQRDPHLPLTDIADVQSQADTRHLAIDRVGIRGIRHPIIVRTASGSVQHTIGTFSMTVKLREEVKGTHMSRFVELLEAERTSMIALDTVEVGALLKRMITKLNVEEGFIDIAFPYFIEKRAPVSQVSSLLDVEVVLRGEMRDGVTSVSTKVIAPVTSLCPCSKEISAYGAHNQRSHITILVQSNAAMPVEDIVRLAEDQASSELYGILKRVDEKFVTERAYDNPKFVEDLVRDLAAALNADTRVDAYVVEAENFESIHNHSAYALIERDKRRI
jgi:GTP cyclohydrolase I